MNNNWLSSVTSFLENNNYQEIINIYEQEIEKNPEIVSNYLYLGLAYLLIGEKEQCQSIWFSIFFELDENDTQKYQKELLNILLNEAQRQENNSYLQLSCLIREEIKEIEPENLSNLLNLFINKARLNSINIEVLEQWQWLQALEKYSILEIDQKILFTFLDLILPVPTEITVNFIANLYSYIKNDQAIINFILVKTETIAEKTKLHSYGVKLLEIIYQDNLDNLENLRKIYIYHSLAYKYSPAGAIALQYEKLSRTIPEKTFASFQILQNLIFSSDWLNVQKYLPIYKENLQNLIKENNQTVIDKYLCECLSTIGRLLLYGEDKPRENRKLINAIGNIFQNQIKVHYNHINCENKRENTNNKKLKIGYIAHSLRSHSVGLLSRWLISHHDKERFSIYGYMNYQYEDYITEKFFREKMDKFYSGGNTVEEYIEEIRKDEIDILVDLDSFTNYLTGIIMALKPAPIQVSWLGMDSNGIPNMDYFIADSHVLPEDAQEYYSEKIWRLPKAYLGVDGFEIDVPNISRESLEIPPDAVIYLNIQNAGKRHPDIIHTQMKIIKAVENSYLLIKGNGDQDILKQLFMEIAEAEGVDLSRLRFLDKTPTEAIHRANLQIADVVLDTYPYNGATTTLETLWMEIPLVTRVGEQFAARNSYTFMINAGITEGIAWSDEEYIEWGIKLGTDENLRKEVSWKLRQSKKTSPLWNGKQFAREMEKAYQQMWEIYVNQDTKIESS